MKKAYGLAFVAIFLWSTSATVSKLLLGSLGSMQVLCISALFASAFWLAVNLFTGDLKELKAYTLKDYCRIVGTGLIGTCLYYLLLYSGMDLMMASQAMTVNYLWTIMSVVFACILLKEKMTVRKGIAIGISFLGVMIVVGRELVHVNTNTLLGTGYCILAAMSYGLFTALNQKHHYNKKIATMIYNLVTACTTGAFLIATGSVPRLDLLQTLGMAYNGTFSLAIATAAWVTALESGKTAKISNLAYITPFLSLVWTAIFLNERITVFSVLGLAVIVLGIFVQIKDQDGQ